MSRKYKFHDSNGVYFGSFAVPDGVDVFTRNELVENQVEGGVFRFGNPVVSSPETNLSHSLSRLNII